MAEPVAAAALILPNRDMGQAVATGWQRRAWDYYGSPDIRGEGAVGEVRYAVGWVAQQVSRVDWTVSIDGEALDADDERTDELIRSVADPGVATQIATNLLVAGQLDYTAWPADAPIVETMLDFGGMLAGSGDTRWLVVSVVDPNRRTLINDATLTVPGIWPHPAQPIQPDPPLRGVLDVLQEIVQLQDLAYAQNRSRIANMSILLVAKEMSMAVGPTGVGWSFGRQVQESIDAPIADPRRTGAAPIILEGPAELIANESAAATLQVGQPYDSRLDERMLAAIRRLSWGLPIPPEILTGMTATNRATAFQIEETAYRSHVEPVASLVGAVFGAAATRISAGDQRVTFTPDPTNILARRHSVSDVKDAWDRGLVNAAWTRSTLGIPEDAAATTEDIDLILTIRSARLDRAVDPSENAAGESIQAAATPRVDLDHVAAELADIDMTLRAELSGAAAIATRRVRERVGARARTALRGDKAATDTIADVPNEQVVSTLGMQLVGSVVDIEGVVAESLDDLAGWWRDQLHDSQAVIGDLVGGGIEWIEAEDESVLVLRASLGAWIVSQLDRTEPTSVPSNIVRDVVEVAGGNRG